MSRMNARVRPLIDLCPGCGRVISMMDVRGTCQDCGKALCRGCAAILLAEKKVEKLCMGCWMRREAGVVDASADRVSNPR